MAWIVNSVAQATPGTTSPRTIVYNGQPGKLYVLYCSRNAAADAFTTVEDDAGNTWTRRVFAPTSGSVGRRIEAWICEPATAFSTLTISFSGTSQAQATLVEISGHNPGAPVDAENAAHASSSTTPPAVNVTPTVAGTLVLGGIQANSNTDAQISSPVEWTRLATHNAGPSLGYRKDVPSGSPVGISWTLTTAQGSGHAILALAPGPSTGLQVTVWNGTTELAATLEGVWNGTTVVSAEIDTVT